MWNLMIMIRKLLLIFSLNIISEFGAFGLGVDWGSEFHKSTMLLPKEGFRMVENHVSARKTPSLISFCGDERFFENQATIKFTRMACETFYMFNRFSELLSTNSTEKLLNNSKLFLDGKVPVYDEVGIAFPVKANIVKNFARNNASYVRQYSEFPESYIRYEEVLGMMLENERNNAIKTGNFEWKSAVFSIWDNSLSIKARKSLSAAIQLGGFTPAAFIHENSAAMVYHAMDSKPTTEESTENVLIVNVGSLGTKLSLIRLESASETTGANTTTFHPVVTVIKDVYNASFSGYLLDMCLADFALSKQIGLMKRVVSKDELSLFKMRRLYTEIKKIKEMLSANKELSFNVEDFFEDRSLNVKLTRGEFEENCEHLFAAFESIIVDFLFSIGKEKISRAEIIGGIVRIPKIQEILKEKFKLPVSVRINGDEGTAHGAAFISANSTAGIKMKKIYFNDGPNYSVNLTVSFPDGENEDKVTELFPFKTNYGTKKKINIKKLRSNALVTLQTFAPGDHQITYNVSGVQKGLDKYVDKNVTEWKVVFNFNLDTLGIPKLASAELILQEEILETKNKTVTKTNATDGSNYTETVSEQIPKTNNFTYKLQVEVESESSKSLLDVKELFNESKAFLKKIRTAEEEKKKLAEMKNKLESYVYRLKSDATDSKENQFLSADEIQQFLNKSSEIEQLLFEGDPANITKENIEVLTMESESLTHILNFRKIEYRERDRVFGLWEQFMVNSTEAIDQIRRERSWTPEEKITEITALVNSAREEIKELYTKQTKMALSEDPIFKAQDISDRVKKITNQINKVGKIQKPKKPANSTADMDGFLKDAMKKFKMNMTGDNLTDDQIDELLKTYKENIKVENPEQSNSEKQNSENASNDSKDSPNSEEPKSENSNENNENNKEKQDSHESNSENETGKNSTDESKTPEDL